jgi:hypothetical protein
METVMRLGMTVALLMSAMAVLPSTAAEDDLLPPLEDDALPPLLGEEDWIWCPVCGTTYCYACIGSGDDRCRFYVYPWYPGDGYGVACDP